MFGLKTVLVLAHKRYLWRKRNADNGTSLGRFVIGTDNITVGRGSYGPISVLTSESNPHVNIGAYCSIAEGVTFVTGDDHPLNTFSTYPFKVMTLGDSNPEAISKGGIEIDDDVWIGFGATILDGVHIHRGGVVAAGAVVTKDVAPYTVVGGVPAKPLRTRFAQDTINKLLAFDYAAMDHKFIETHIDALYSPLEPSVLGGLLNDAGSGNEL